MSYSELLKDPRWQKKRLEIMERDKWTCQTCGDTEATLTVHHKSYRMTDGKFADIWDYPGDDLITLCDDCHSEEESKLTILKKSIYFDIRSMCENADTINDLMDCFERVFKENNSARLSSADLYSVFLCDTKTIERELNVLARQKSFDDDDKSSQVVDCCHFIINEGLKVQE